VGSLAVQIAKARGADVTGVCSTSKVELVRSLGAHDVLDYTREDIADGRRRWDVVLDTAGNRPLSVLRRALAPAGSLVIVGAETGGRWLGGTDRQMRALLLSPFVRQRLRVLASVPRGADLWTLAELAGSDRLTPVIDRSFALDEAAKALRHLEDGHARGKIVITP
jgi:NADPH:quinone reductase-like Zn-dependent oxidoreductase